MRPRFILVLYDDRGLPALEINMSTLQALGAVKGAEPSCLTSQNSTPLGDRPTTSLPFWSYPPLPQQLFCSIPPLQKVDQLELSNAAPLGSTAALIVRTLAAFTALPLTARLTAALVTPGSRLDEQVVEAGPDSMPGVANESSWAGARPEAALQLPAPAGVATAPEWRVRANSLLPNTCIMLPCSTDTGAEHEAPTASKTGGEDTTGGPRSASSSCASTSAEYAGPQAAAGKWSAAELSTTAGATEDAARTTRGVAGGAEHRMPP